MARRRRRRLALALLDPAGQDPEAVARACELAGWPTPRARGSSSPIPTAPVARAPIDRTLAGEAAALGPTVAPAAAADSLRWARLTLELARTGALGAA